MINVDTIARMKPDAVLINVGRGDLVDPVALTAALQSGQLAGAALDVFQPEPIPADHPILRLDNVVVSSHVASASVPAMATLRETAATIAAKSLQGQPLPNIVN